MATAAGIPRSRIAQVLGMTGLTEARHRQVGGFSLGMRQRLTWPPPCWAIPAC